jgi:CRP-like cAMP-binding protein
MRHEAGRVLFMRGAAAPEVHVLLDGQVSMTASSGTTVAEAPLALGLQEVLEGAAMRSTVTTAGAAITLTLTPDELLTLLSEHAGLTVGLFRWIIALNGAGAPVVSGHADAALVARVLRSGAVADRALLLHANPLFARATAAQLWRLAAIARPTSLAAGDRAFGRGGAAAMVIVLDGELAVDRPGAERQLARPGDIVGMYETLAGLDVTAKVVASVDTRVLRIDGAELFDLIADHTDLLQGVFAGLVGG